MRSSILFVAAALSLTQVAIAFDNIPPIPERHVGWTYGEAKVGVEIEVVYDILCSDCKMNDPLFQAFLDKPFNNSTVRDNVRVTYVVMPLPYHHEAWVASKLLPYFIDGCLANSTQCQYYEYLNYTFNYQTDLLTATDKPEIQLVDQWTNQTAAALNLNVTELKQVYTDADSHNSEGRTRYMWKYATHRGVSGTPTAFVNGVLIQNWPADSNEWFQLLTDVVGDQTYSSARLHQSKYAYMS